VAHARFSDTGRLPLHWRQQIWRPSSKTITVDSPAAVVFFLLKSFVLIFCSAPTCFEALLQRGAQAPGQFARLRHLRFLAIPCPGWAARLPGRVGRFIFLQYHPKIQSIAMAVQTIGLQVMYYSCSEARCLGSEQNALVNAICGMAPKEETATRASWNGMNVILSVWVW
jgi:hypothetical protein